MNRNVAVVQDGEADVLAVVRASIMPPGSGLEDLHFYMAWCRMRQVDPVSQAFVIKQGGKLVPGVTIAGLRAIAARSGKYGPQDGPRWMDENGEWFDVWTDDTPPTAARVGVKQTDWDAYTYGTATWREFGAAKAGQNFSPWKTQPAHMLAIRAEADALRRAFPADLGGMYTREELQSENGPNMQVDTSTGEILSEPTPISKGQQMTAAQAQQIARLLHEADITGEAKDQLLGSWAGTTDYKRITKDGAARVITELEHIISMDGEADADSGNVMTEADWEAIDGDVIV